MAFSIDKENKKINVVREFASPLQTVWDAWTQSDKLDKWWAPSPWKAVTRSMNFVEGGYWLYAMVGPDDEKHWARFDFNAIDAEASFSGQDAFCDENGVINETFARSQWTNTFSATSGKTTVTVEIAFNTVADMEQLLEMGFKEGFTMGLDNLAALLAG